VNRYEKQEEERKTRFFEENDSEKILEQSQLSETKRNTTWVLKLFQSKKPLLCFEFNNPISKMFMRLIYLKNSTFLSLKIIVYTDWFQERNITTPLLKIGVKMNK